MTGLLARIDSKIERIVARRAGALERDRAFADALRTIAAATAAGATLPQALRRAGATREAGVVAIACDHAAARIALGLPIEQEIDQLARRIDTPSARLFARVVHVQHRRGGDLGAPSRRLAMLVHDRVRLDAEARSATAQARFSARAVLAIPLLLAIAAAWRAPDQVRSFLQPGTVLIAAPGILLIAAGAVAAHRIARAAVSNGVGGGVHATRPRRRVWIEQLAGTGPLASRSLRLMSVAGVLVVIAGMTGSTTAMACALVLVVVAALWPWSHRAHERRRRADIAASGIESLLEVSIALFAAGATAHEVATQAPESVPEPLRSALAPAVHRVGLGRSITSAFGQLPEVAASPQLDGWLHAVCASQELGASAINVLDQLLRDARSMRREQLRSAAQTAAPRMQLALVLLVVPGVMWLMLLATVGGLVRQLQAGGVM